MNRPGKSVRERKADGQQGSNNNDGLPAVEQLDPDLDAVSNKRDDAENFVLDNSECIAFDDVDDASAANPAVDAATTATSGTGAQKASPRRAAAANASHADGLVAPPKAEDVDPALAEQPIAFYIAGYIDGMCKQLGVKSKTGSGNADNGDDDWLEEDVVIEIKCRVGTLKASAPMYDQIQCVLYMLMTGARRAELVEYLRDQVVKSVGGSNSSGSRVGGGGRAVASSAPSAQPSGKSNQHRIQMRVHQVSLDGAPHHGKHWGTTIMPRLVEVATAIHQIRSSDHLRYRWLYAMASLQSDPNACWQLMAELAPFIGSSVMPQVLGY